MSNSWDKVRSFLDMMDIQDLHSPLPSSVSTFSDSSNCDLQPLSIGAGRWHVGDKMAEQILSIIQPNAGSENRRERIIKYLQRLIEYAFKTKVFPFGSVPLKTYLPHGDIDLTAVNYSISSDDLAAGICSLLENEARNNTTFQVKDVLCVPAQVRVVKCTVDGICVDISFNQTAGLYALYFFDKVDQSIGKDHLFKRSVILIKAWCYYESRLLGGYYGLISTYALETMVLHVINLFHSTLPCPLAVLQKFLEYYSTFEWNKYCVRVDGLVLISTLPEIVVLSPPECDDALLSDAILRSYREVTLSAMGMGVVGSKNPAFPVKFLNILDPLRDDNNLGRSVSKGNFHRIRSALSYGAQKLGDILMLPLENIKHGLEIYFKDTLERNGKGSRADVDVPVSAYGSETSSGNSGDDHLSGLHYGLWVHYYGAIYPIVSNTSESDKVWNNRWPEMVYNAQCDQNIYYGKSIDKSPPSSFDGVRSIIPSKAASVKENRKSRGTGTFIPYPYHRLRRNIVSVANGEENEAEKELENEEELESEKVVETVDSPTSSPREANLSSDEAVNTEPFNYSIEEFPVLPGSKPIPIKVCLETVQVNDNSESFDSLEFGNFKHSPSISPSVSETSKQSDSDVSINLDLVGDPTVAISEGQESSKIKEIPLGLVQPPQLKDDQEFPPLSRSAEAVITIDKKEFPPLCAYSRSHKSKKGTKDFK
ncbi:uncharacterized protein LOC130801417 [Amaranthus tricolor]|uniref:uncharacterized protein LOC130801417 n=1 Tax=Amaranthus tricolor TaxID=29722 RepID=UPI002584703F|nr:uncharacterized protein LOC130801417 [Amaranthus tricolor]XP_057521249.1 uncharacterized protein LOC130801417 [Amaranthus tricolor]XP_057521250.1 uncharacterized protein LOC130801417 [Amaranthus tricolor]XP_057521251.1 uncharacterized protein LOC130801417 [Amaranthus tricolor]